MGFARARTGVSKLERQVEQGDGSKNVVPSRCEQLQSREVF